MLIVIWLLIFLNGVGLVTSLDSPKSSLPAYKVINGFGNRQTEAPVESLQLSNKLSDSIDGPYLEASLDEKRPWYMEIFPIYPKELVKFFSLSMMMFWIIFVFTMTRDTKDTLIVTTCGAEAIAFLKVYGVVPAATGFMILYAKLANTLQPRTLFYVTLAPFFVFYFFFAFVMYPMRGILHPLHIKVPTSGLSFAVNILRYWTFSLYYIVSEIWGSAGIPLLFWSCANDVVLINQAKRMYPLMSLVGNLGPIVSGLAMTQVSKFVRTIHADDDVAFEASLKILTSFMTVAGGIVMGLYWFINKRYDEEKAEIEAAVAAAPPSPVTKSGGGHKKSKAKLSFVESIRVLGADPYLRSIATMVVSYGLTMEFTEIIWKASVKKAFPIKTDYLAFMGRYSTMIGIASFFMMLVGTRVVALGWRIGALMTPVMMALLAAPFFGFITFGGTTSPRALLIAVYVGLVQNILSKATKYTVFDSTKEMTYIPLDTDGKTKGKAAIDVLGARLGKSGGALSQQLLVVACGSIMGGAPVLAVLFYLVVFAWIGAVNGLAPMFKERTDKMELERRRSTGGGGGVSF